VSRGGAVGNVAVEATAEVFEAIAGEPSLRGHTRVTVGNDESAAASLRIAMRGTAILVHAVATRTTLDRLYEDLRRLGPVVVRTGVSPPAARALLDHDEASLLRLLASGMTLREAALELHISPRTADRRLAGARAKLNATTTIEAVAAFTR
jgi:DNA-binding NarL/FixJ family response regulator